MRQNPDQIFKSMKETFFGSPARTFEKEACNNEMKSTNQFAPYSNTFHKVTNGGINFKNYSEIQLGYN